MFDTFIDVKRLAIMLTLVACGGGGSGGGTGDGSEGSDCRSTADCDDGLGCAGVNDGPVCGIPPRQECTSNADCFGGSVCHAIFDACSADFVGSTCGEACVDGMDCEPNFTCDAGNCVAQTCDAGFTCEGREECDPGRIALTAPVFEQHHGCFAVECDADDECGDRFCVNGTCQDASGSCAEPFLVP